MPKGIRKTPEEKEIERLAKLAEKEAKKAEKLAANEAVEPGGEKIEGDLEEVEIEELPKFDPNAKVDVVNPNDLGRYYVRTYSEELHGKDYEKLAEKFANSSGYQVVGHDKSRVPGFKPGTPAYEETLGKEK